MAHAQSKLHASLKATAQVCSHAPLWYIKSEVSFIIIMSYAELPMARNRCSRLCRWEFHCSRLCFSHNDWRAFAFTPVSNTVVLVDSSSWYSVCMPCRRKGLGRPLTQALSGPLRAEYEASIAIVSE